MWAQAKQITVYKNTKDTHFRKLKRRNVDLAFLILFVLSSPASSSPFARFLTRYFVNKTSDRSRRLNVLFASEGPEV